jgi:hypothetical protein
MVDTSPPDLYEGWTWSWVVEGSTTGSEVEVTAAAAGETRRADETSTAAIEAIRGRFMTPLSGSDQRFTSVARNFQVVHRSGM